jgi:hypothetical protein
VKKKVIPPIDTIPRIIIPNDDGSVLQAYTIERDLFYAHVERYRISHPVNIEEIDYFDTQTGKKHLRKVTHYVMKQLAIEKHYYKPYTLPENRYEMSQISALAWETCKKEAKCRIESEIAEK